MTATQTMTLESFLAQYAVCRVWYTSVGSPAGAELALNTDDDAGEDYCDAESLIGVIPEGADESVGEVTLDPDGEHRWDSAIGESIGHDCRQNTVTRLVVWGV